jgi:hypothetical protein
MCPLSSSAISPYEALWPGHSLLGEKEMEQQIGDRLFTWTFLLTCKYHWRFFEKLPIGCGFGGEALD